MRKKEMITIFAMCILMALLIPAASADTCSFCEFINISNITRGVTDHAFLTNLSADNHPQYILTDGTRAFTGKQSLGGFNLTDLLDPVALQDAATKNYVDLVNASQTAYTNAANASMKSYVDTKAVSDHGLLSNLSGDGHPQYILVSGTRAFTGKQSLGGFNLTDLLDPVALQDAATKNYVDLVNASQTAYTNAAISLANTSMKNYVDAANVSMQAYVDAHAPITDHGLLSNLSGDGHPQYLLVNGSRAMTGNLSVGSHYVTNVLDPSVGTDAATKGYVDSVNTSMKNYVDAANASMALNVSLNYASKVSGKVPTGELGSGTAKSTTVLAGDQTWKPGITVLKKTSNQTINSGAGTFVDISELTFPVTAGNIYAFHYYIAFSSKQATTGWKMGVNAPNGNLDFWAESQTIANNAVGAATHTERHNVQRDDMTILANTVTANVRLANRIDGIYECTQDGTFAPRFANELAADTNITVLNGSYGWYF
jgi:hypothetical protein